MHVINYAVHILAATTEQQYGFESQHSTELNLSTILQLK